ncbi:MAG: hypothetical protein Q8Q14_00670 [Gemmatimonadales bacterium]|nr:hypothetical protein [Gemmatimonadales bacterium]
MSIGDLVREAAFGFSLAKSGIARSSMTIGELVREAHGTARAKGWHDDDETPPDPIRIVAWLGLVCSEAAEAMEDVRLGNMALTFGEDGKPEGLPSELADILIRVADIAGALGIDLEAAVVAKASYNARRSRRHGGKAA